MAEALETAIRDGAAEYGLSLPDEAIARFARYCEILTEKNKVMNLTAISGEFDIATVHFLDSLAPLTLPCMRAPLDGARLLDVGSGAGLPGLPLRIAAPELGVTLLDAHGKRVAFLEELCRALDIRDAVCVHARAEEFARTSARDSYDFVISRAVAKLNVLCELCLPLVRPGGYFIAMKSADSDGETAGAVAAINALGGETPELYEYTVPGAGIARRLAVTRKVSATPPEYPRRFARIARDPL
ncbi:MAG: 16S rRNA (guanine(527)-N(7))-methyltransferase RsmG [Oscillospiraceae bacterium]|jgi:16S rRNA (guanine527-N7)-methyltransferase|nr:16S rRNA (guanine(527)-N(7))-methyltransferase RsmG [Oscillospiraceae bacterium]